MITITDRARVVLPAHVGQPGEPRLRGRALVLTWIATVSLGEGLAFLAPAFAGVAMASLPPVEGGLLLLAAGAMEGAILGWAQARVLRRALPTLRSRRWIALTATGAFAAYCLGFVMTALAATEGLSTILAMSATGILLLSSIGIAQWQELRHHVRDADRWVVWTAAAWLCGLATFLLIATPLWHTGQSAATAIAIGVVAGLAMATAQAVVTGWGLLRLLRNRGRP